MNYKNADMDVAEEFKKVMERMKKPENSTKYDAICVGTCNEDEERIWKLCKYFWHPDYEEAAKAYGKSVYGQHLKKVAAGEIIASRREY